MTHHGKLKCHYLSPVRHLAVSQCVFCKTYLVCVHHNNNMQTYQVSRIWALSQAHTHSNHFLTHWGQTGKKIKIHDNAIHFNKWKLKWWYAKEILTHFSLDLSFKIKPGQECVLLDISLKSTNIYRLITMYRDVGCLKKPQLWAQIVKACKRKLTYSYLWFWTPYSL